MLLRLIIFSLVTTINSAEQSNKTEKAPKKQDQAPIGVQILCARNSHRTSCPPCEGTCTNTHPMCSKRPCLLGAPPRCVCNSGFVRSGGQCIPILRCPRPRCPTNQIWKKCPTPCEPTCADPWPTCNFNIKQPCVGKCQCRPGFYRQSSAPNAPCVPWIQCRPFTIGPLLSITPRPPIPDPTGGEKPWNWWGVPPPKGPKTTNQHRKKADKEPRVQNQEPVIGVVNLCGRNSHRVRCPPCEGTCTNPTPICPQFFVCNGPVRCQCDGGYVRTALGCVPISSCPRPRCGTNQVWNWCSTIDEPSCQRSYPIVINPRCGVPKCQCRPGFYRRSSAANAPCVRWLECRPFVIGPFLPTVRSPLPWIPEFGDTRPFIWWGITPRRSPSKQGRKKTEKAPKVQNQDQKVDITPIRIPPIIPPFPICVPNSHRTMCFRCEGTCERPNPIPCTILCVRRLRCQCDAGYVRSGGQCIKPTNCPKTCGANQVWKPCATSCEPSCANLFPDCVFRVRCIGKCQCKPGFYRRTSAPNSPCVPWRTCRPFVLIDTIVTPRPPITDPTGGTRPWNWWGVVPGPMRTQQRKTNPVASASKTIHDRKVSQKAPRTQNQSTIGDIFEGIGDIICLSRGNCFPRPRVCPFNQEFTRCGTACPPTCSNPNPPCTRQCVTGCQCRRGFIRNINNQCIPINTCPTAQLCPSNEVYQQCGTACQPTCTNRNPICTFQCVPGCFCAQGYIRDSNYQCVPMNSCPSTQTCSNNEVYRPCGTACQPTCENRNPPCTLQCVPGCQCAQGYIRNSQNQCIPLNSCPIICPANQIYRPCGTACEPTCDNRNPTCTQQCVPGCQCAQGYIRNSNNLCIPISSCPVPTCPTNQVYASCGTACQPTCENRNPVCTLQCVPGCQCAQGYIRNSQNQCIPVNSCPIICPANQIYRPCGTACEPTCDNRNPSCTSGCVPGCQCAQGYIRNSNNLCIPVNTCPTPICPNANEVWTQQCSCEQNCQQTSCAEFCISPRCQCAPGFVRDNGQCIRSWDCPVQSGSCDSNQVWTQCSTVCEPSCGNFNPTCWSFACGPPKCQCSPNFYRRFDSPNSDCVPWWKCGGRNTSPRPWEQWEGGRGRGKGRGRG